MQTLTIHLFIFSGMAEYETAFATAWINNPAFQRTPGRYRVVTVAENKDPVTSMGGLTIVPDLTVAELTPNRSAMLILPGGMNWLAGKNQLAIAKAAEFVAAGKPVAAICAATAALAKAGLLDNRKHTSNALEFLQGTGYKGAELYMHQPAVTDALIITAGGAASLDFAAHIATVLDLYQPEILDSLLGLFRTADPAHFYRLMQLAK